MRKTICFILVGLLSACGGGGGSYSSANCTGADRNCSLHIPSKNRGDSSEYTPSEDRGDTGRVPSEDRGGKQSIKPNTKEDQQERPSRKRFASKQLKFIINDSHEKNNLEKITAIKVDDTVFKRLDGTNKFTNDDSILTYKSIGKELGLSYSDFGTYTIIKEQIDINTETETKETVLDNAIFAGGYDSHKIAMSDIASNVNFTGQAVGNASDSQHTVNLDGTATLSFDKESGTSTLGASFNNWYDIQVTDNGAIEFSNYTNTNNLVKLDAAPDDNGIITDTGAKMDVGYYGPHPDAGIPTEATGLVQYQENTSGVKMDIAFGAN